MNSDGRHALIVRADLAELECLGWPVVATSGTAAIEFYIDVLDGTSGQGATRRSATTSTAQGSSRTQRPS
jgi:hypothetical protein